MTLTSLLILYSCFRAKQFVCDFALQSKWIATTKEQNSKDGYYALFVHSLIHAAGILAIAVLFNQNLWWLAGVDLIVHGFVDLTKSRIVKHYGWTSSQTAFWWAIGLDQELHNFTHIFYIMIFVLAGG